MPKRPLKIAPSILAGDFACLGEEAKRIEDAGADWLHLDVMDGNFVPNITFGPQAVAAVNCRTKMFLDVHIMVYNPHSYIEAFVEAGADQITFHFEATEDVQDTIDFIRRCNVRAGLAFCPGTSESLMLPYLDKIDNLLLMTVNPGFGGQTFMPEVLEKISFARGYCEKLSSGEKNKEMNLGSLDIQVDGGINFETAKACVDAGANVLVAGTYLFNSEDMKSSVKELKTL